MPLGEPAKRIAIVSKPSDFLSNMVKFLGDAGYEVLWFSSSQEADAAFNVDVFIFDYALEENDPDTDDGAWLMIPVKVHHPGARFIGMGDGGVEVREAFEASGADSFWPKAAGGLSVLLDLIQAL